jgi:copper chaperone
MPLTTYRVTGMTCSHCADAVTREVSAVAGVDGVEVSVETGTLRVTGEAVRDEDVRAAVDEAGYSVA